MTEVVIRNKELLETLNSFSDEMLSKPSYNDEKYWTYHERKDVDLGSYYTSREYLEDCLSRGRDGLVGPPDRYFANQFLRWCARIKRCGVDLCKK